MSTFVFKNLRQLFDKYAVVKSTTKIFSNFVAFSENTNFNKISRENFSLVNFSGGTLVKGADGSGILQKFLSHLFSPEFFFTNSDKYFVRNLGADSLFLEQK